MPPWLIHGAAIAGRVLAGLVGCVCFYLAFFLYEDEEGVWQNKIDGLWASIHDRSMLTDNTSTALFNKIGDTLNRSFDKVFGKPLFSWRSIGVSLSLSLCFISVGAIPIAIIGLLPALALPAIFLVVVFSRQPAKPWQLRVLRYAGFVLLPFVALGCVVIFVIIKIEPILLETALPVYLLLTLASDFLMIAIIRKIFSSISTTVSVTRIIISMFGLLIFGVALMVIAPFYFGTFGIFLDLMNLATTLYCLIPTAMLAIVLLHKITWPTLGRLTYPLCRHRVVSNKKVLISIGTLCLVLAFNLEHIGIKEFIKLFS